MSNQEVNYVCDLCGQSFDNLADVTTHLQQAHGIEEPIEVGKIDQSQPGKLILQHTGEEPLEIDLNEWVKQQLTPTMEQPSMEQLDEWLEEGGCYAIDGCWVESDGTCPHGAPSWLLYLNLI